MAAPGDAQLFAEEFNITALDNSKYDRVARLSGISLDSSTTMFLDINTELFPCAQGENIQMVLASSLALDGSKDDTKGWRDFGKANSEEATLADMFDYVCHGKIYKFDDDDVKQQVKAFISFGGLLLGLEGPYKKLTPLRIDNVYLLMKK